MTVELKNSTADLLAELNRNGVMVLVDGHNLKIKCVDPVKDEIREILKQRKQEIINLLFMPTKQLISEMERRGISEKWRGYLLERVQILVGCEGFSPEKAKEEVHNMVEFYKNLN